MKKNILQKLILKALKEENLTEKATGKTGCCRPKIACAPTQKCVDCVCVWKTDADWDKKEAGGCTSDKDCDPNQHCVDGACIMGGVKNTSRMTTSGGCTSNSDCGGGECCYSLGSTTGGGYCDTCDKTKKASKKLNEEKMCGCADGSTVSFADCSSGSGGVTGCEGCCDGGYQLPADGGKIKTKGKKKVREAEMTAGAENTKFTIKVDVSNKQSETKLGIRIQLTPKDGMLESDVRDKLEVAITKKLNTSLGEFDIQVSKDTDVPDPAIIGFFIPLSQIKNMIVKSIKGGTAPTNGAPTPPPPARPTPPTPAVPPAKPATPTAPATTNEVILKEMRVRDLKEISKVVIKEDFYAFINAGQNVLRTMEERGMDNGKKYLEYLVKHNIM